MEVIAAKSGFNREGRRASRVEKKVKRQSAKGKG
jgi:hypothetical protein